MKLLILLAALVGGSAVAEGTACPGVTFSYDLVFRGGEKALITVTGDGNGDIDCELYDSQGKLLALDAAPGDRCRIEWTPKTTSTLTLLVSNSGTKCDRFLVVAH